MRITAASKIRNEGGVKIAIHSVAGMGKTMLAATCEKPIIILTERTGASCLSAENIEKVFSGVKYTTKIPVVEAYTVSEFQEAIDKLTDDSRFKTIIIDSVSELSKMLLKEALPNYKNKLQAYGDQAEQIDNFIRSLNSSTKNIVFLFHSIAVDSYDEEGDPTGTVMLPGFEGQKMRTDFTFLNGDIFCMVNDFDDEGEETRMLRTVQGDTNQYAKNRSGGLDELEKPHLQSIINKIKKS